MKIIKLFLLILGVAAIGAAGFFAFADMPIEQENTIQKLENSNFFR